MSWVVVDVIVPICETLELDDESVLHAILHHRYWSVVVRILAVIVSELYF